MPLEDTEKQSRTSARLVTVHATCIRWGVYGLLIRGGSGVGKSDLALRMVGRGGLLIADDLVQIRCEDDRLIASAVNPAGAIELRGQGVYRLPSCIEAGISALVQLEPTTTKHRLPPPEAEDLMGFNVPLIRIDPNRPSVLDRLRVFLSNLRLA